MMGTSGRDPAGFSFDTPQVSNCENGTVGWTGDTAEAKDWFSLGTGDDDGLLLVHVTLFRGKSPDVEIRPGVAQGMPILCRVNTMFGHRIPPLGTAVLVMCDGRWELHANPVIVAIVEKNPIVQIEDDRVVVDFGPDAHVLFRGKSVTLQDTPDGDDKSSFVGVGTPRGGGNRGIYALDETGSGFSTQSGEVGLFSTGSGGAAKSMVHLTGTEADVVVKGSSLCGLKAIDGDVTLLGANAYLYAAGVYLGALATALNTALWGPTGVAGAASTSVYMSP